MLMMRLNNQMVGHLVGWLGWSFWWKVLWMDGFFKGSDWGLILDHLVGSGLGTGFTWDVDGDRGAGNCFFLLRLRDYLTYRFPQILVSKLIWNSTKNVRTYLGQVVRPMMSAKKSISSPRMIVIIAKSSLDIGVPHSYESFHCQEKMQTK